MNLVAEGVTNGKDRPVPVRGTGQVLVDVETLGFCLIRVTDMRKVCVDVRHLSRSAPGSTGSVGTNASTNSRRAAVPSG